MTAHNTLFLGAAIVIAVAGVALAQPETRRLTGQAAYGDWQADSPGLWRRLTPADLPAPGATPSAGNPSKIAPRPPGAMPKVPAGFVVSEFATGLDQPRLLRAVPNGDIFVVESAGGRVKLLRPSADGTKAGQTVVFAEGLTRPFGLILYPEADPKWVYVANNNSVVRFPYRVGDDKPRGPAETVIAKLTDTDSGHFTRDLALSRDGRRLLVSVGSQSNVPQGTMPTKTPAEIAAWEKDHGLGASWGPEADRAAVLSFTPEGGDRKVFATGIRNCVGLTRQPATGEFWCATNERDALGDNLVPDYVTRVKAGGYYGWPWYYIGDHEDPRLKGARPDLAGKATVPDVLIQPHSAALQLAFYEPQGGQAAFPAEYRGDAFVTLHGSWNRAMRTGYKVVRVKLNHGVPTGEYQDFLTGLVGAGDAVWGRPVGVAVARDGALLVSEDANGMVWRIAYEGRRLAQR